MLTWSQFVKAQLQQNPQWLTEFVSRAPAQDDVSHWASIESEAELMTAVRQYRQRQMCRIAWRDLTAASDLITTMADCSQLADTVISAVVEWLRQRYCQEFGIPNDPKHSLLVIAMGKLGGFELNFSSDVDLIFSYIDDANVSKTAAQDFYQRLAQRLIHILQSKTEDGFVFRVDMRLRPFGDSGPLVLSATALASYYQEQGRPWERYAMLKARAINGDKQQRAVLYNLLKPFVYRRYVDYGSIESLRDMKRLIQREVATKNLYDDVKRGPGGIRQIEFIGQVFQLIHGGQERRLQQRKLLPVLRYLKTSQTLAAKVVDELQAAYLFLRNVEHRLQMVDDQQTHTLPNDAFAQWRLASSMGYQNWELFLADLSEHRDNVHQHFEQMLMQANPPLTENNEYGLQSLSALWQGDVDSPESLQLLTQLGFTDAAAARGRLLTFHDSFRVRQLQSQPRERLESLIPLIMHTMTEVDNPDETLIYVIDLLEAIVRRSAYLVLLIENPPAVTRLIRLFAKSPWIAVRVISFPFLLDEFIHEFKIDQATHQDYLEDSLRQALIGVAEHDIEEQMETLRSFKLRQELRAAVAECEGTLPIMKVSDILSFSAGIILRQVQDIALKELLTKPQYQDVIEPERLNQFAIIAYGKLGGIEMSYASDLDLVFIHDMGVDCQIPVRLAQRIISMLTTRTTKGVLYQVDTRLRPSGSAGLLVSSVDAFIQYQHQSAWTWEHQALVRSRVISGSAELMARFNQARIEVLRQQRDLTLLKTDVINMRERMLSQLTLNEEVFEVKSDPGGITDIEFIVQFAVLAWAHEHPALTTWPDNIRVLASLADEGCLDEESVHQLSSIYQAYRAIVHRSILSQTNATAEAAAYVGERSLVMSVWNQTIGQLSNPCRAQ